MAKSMKSGKGGRFKRLSGGIKGEYERKGYDAKNAARIADATAAKIGRDKYGSKRMSRMAKKGKK